LIELSETYVVIEVGVSTAERSEHLFEADIFVVDSVEDTEETLGHTFLGGEALSRDFATISLFSILLFFLVSRPAVVAIFKVSVIFRVVVIPGASLGVSSSGSGSESTATVAIVFELIFVPVRILFIPLSHAQNGFGLSFNFILVVKVVLSATTYFCLTVVSLVFIAIAVISLISGLLVLIVVFYFLLSLDLCLRSGTNSPETSDLTIHCLQELILF
jgi:hypothetical protein